MEKKQILITTIGKFPHVGGKSVHIETLTRSLPKASNGKFSPKVLSFSDLGPFVQTFCSLPRVFKDIPLDFVLRRYFLKKHLGKEILSQVPLFLVQESSSFQLAEYAGKPFILTVHGSSCDEYASSKAIPFGGRSYKKLLQEEIEAAKRAAFVITVDTNLKNQILERSHIDGSKVTVLPNTVDTDVFSPEMNKKAQKEALGLNPSDFVTVVVRRLVPKNGVQFAILALAKLQQKNVKLVVAGDGPERKSLEELVAQLHLEDKVVFLGAIQHHRTPELLRCADLCLIPSVPDQNVVEATSISALEAMATALPVVASGIGGLKELLEGGAGVLVPPADPEALAAAWKNIINNPVFGESLGVKARAKVLQEYSLDKWIGTYIDLIERTIEASTGR